MAAGQFPAPTPRSEPHVVPLGLLVLDHTLVCKALLDHLVGPGLIHVIKIRGEPENRIAVSCIIVHTTVGNCPFSMNQRGATCLKSFTKRII